MKNYLDRYDRNLSLFDDLFDDYFDGNRTNGLMKTDIVENNNSYTFHIEVPSVKKGDIKVSVDNGYLNVEIDKHNTNLEKDSNGKVIHKERYFGSYKRSFYVGKDIKGSDINASLENGVLSLEIAKPQAPQKEEKKYIEIK